MAFLTFNFLKESDVKKLMTVVMAACLTMAAGGAFAQDAMKKDAMGKKDEMKKDAMGKKDGMKKDAMSNESHKMEKSGGMMKKDEMKK
jgi:pentapeptide MXKDX repeat protein